MLPIDEDENGTYIMNSRDLCAIRILERLKNVGINSFKIEGRNKSVYYVSTVTGAYRKAIDNIESGRPFDENLEKEMFAVANRGYITGFLEKNPHHLGENLSESHSGNQTHQFSGIVQRIEPDKLSALIAVRNRFEVGDEMEVLSPSGTEIFRIERISSISGDSLDVAHGGGIDVIINVPEGIGDYSLIRRPINNR